MSSASVILRNLHDADGFRHLSASVSEAGDLIIEGQDVGDGVERVFGPGVREYDWAWTVRAKAVPRLLEALKSEGQLLDALADRFSGVQAADVKPFLDDNNIEYEAWSRVGD